jgi:SAM-dependent MidA family methyltransferase
VDWLTPVEVFAPWYGRAIAHYMAELRRHSSLGGHGPLTIIEVGGGTGTLAASILVSVPACLCGAGGVVRGALLALILQAAVS